MIQYDSAAYVPGVCNIGPAEIARRRRTGHVGVAATVAALGIAVLTGAPRPLRLLVGVPAATAASGYLQARARFCAGFGSMGVMNFGEVGATEAVADPDARAADRAMARRIGFRSSLVGAAVGVGAALLPR